ncbi:MAG: hypothetical protein AB1649_07575 [Chloroflexota bacterium]
MSNRSNKNKSSAEEKRTSRNRRIMQIAFAIFSLLLILSMVLSAVSTY